MNTNIVITASCPVKSTQLEYLKSRLIARFQSLKVFLMNSVIQRFNDLTLCSLFFSKAVKGI